MILYVSSCSKGIREKSYDEKISEIDAQCIRLNVSIESLQVLVQALKSNTHINDIVIVVENGEQVGYTISFTNREPIIVYNRKVESRFNLPIIGVKENDNGIWYWTLNGGWLLNANGERIKVESDGEVLVPPRFKIVEDYWYISNDDGQTWTILGEAYGEDGEHGESLFNEIRQDEWYVYFVLNKDQTITLRKSDEPKKYGVKWSITDMNDLGSRCFNAVGKTAAIGVGRANGYSDFDMIYPWSEIKRCNISYNKSGTKIITFEGEDGFSTEGRNGDVFVRIPRFCVDKYIKDGYEYRVVTRSDGNLHPAFIEDGKELNEIFVGAFEGIIEDGKLFSIGGLIPTSNVVAQDYLDAAKARGGGYTLYDMRTVDAIWTLYAVEFGSRNTNQYLGFGYADFWQPVKINPNIVQEAAIKTNRVKTLKLNDFKRLIPIGSNITICKDEQTSIITQAKVMSIKDIGDYSVIEFDGPPIDVNTDCFIGSAACTTNFCEECGEGKELTWHTGRALFVDGNNQEMQNPMRYRWIENLIGSLWHFLPDVSFNALQMYVCDSIDGYEFFKTLPPYRPSGDILPVQVDNGQKNDGIGVNHWVDVLINDEFYSANVFGKSYSDYLTCRQSFGGFYYLKDGIVCIVNGGGFDHANRCNMLTNRAWIEPTRRWYLYGARLIYKRIE